MHYQSLVRLQMQYIIKLFYRTSLCYVIFIIDLVLLFLKWNINYEY